LPNRRRDKDAVTSNMDSQDILLLTGLFTLLGSLIGLAAAARWSGSLFNTGCVFYGFWIIYFAIPMLDMATRRQMEPILYAADNFAVMASSIAIALSLLLFSVIYFAYKVRTPQRLQDSENGSSDIWMPHWFLYFACILLAVGSVGKWQVISSLGGMSVDLMLNLSASVRHAGGAQASAAWSFVASLFDAGLYMLIFYTIVTRQHYLLITALVLVGIASTLSIGGKRIAALGFIVAAAVWYIQARQMPFKAQLSLLVAAFAVSMLGLLGRIAIPTWLIGSAEHTTVAVDTVTRPLQTVLDSGELGLFEGTSFAFEARDDFLSGFSTGLHLLAHQTISSTLFIVPRALWPGKPEAFDFSQIFYSLMIADDRSTGWAIGPVGVGYIWGGWIGVALNVLVAAGLARLVDSELLVRTSNMAVLFILPFVVISYFHLLRFGSPGFVLVNAYVNLLPLVGVAVLLSASGTKGAHAPK
jgi:hypothetical protein